MISHSSEIGTLLFKDEYIIIININSINHNFKFVKIKIETELAYKPTSSITSIDSNSILSIYIKLTDNNINLFQM